MIKASNDPHQRLMLEEFNRVLDNLWIGEEKNLNCLEEESLEKKKIAFYPNVIVNCKYRKEMHNGRSNSGTAPIKRSFSNLLLCHSQLANAIQSAKLKFFRQSHQQKLYFGSCAEDDAANNILTECSNKKIPLPPKLSDLKFTPAQRPRTREHVPYCTICEHIFG